jgi:integrase
MASVSVQKNPASSKGKPWRVMWRDKQRKPHQESFATKREANAKAAQLRVDLETGNYIDPSLRRVTVGAQYGYWQAHRMVSNTRQATEDSAAKCHLLPRWGDTPLEDVTFDAAQAWVNELARAHSRAHAVTCYRLLWHTMASAVRSKKMPSNPVEHVAFPRGTRKILTWDDVLTGAELRHTAEQTDPRWGAFVFLTGWLGWRLSEGLGIRRCDVNLLRAEVTVGRVVVEEVNGRCRARKSGKTDAAPRVVPLPASCAKALERHLLEYVDDPHPEAFLFLRPDGCHPLRSTLLRGVLYPALARAGHPPRSTVHRYKSTSKKRGTVTGWSVKWYEPDGRLSQHVVRDEKAARALAAEHGGSRDIDFRQLRHTAASLMIDAGVDILDVSQRLGHARPSITMDIYTHLLASKSKRGTEKIEQAIRESERPLVLTLPGAGS